MKAQATRIRMIIYCLPFLWDLAISKKKRKYSEKPEAKPRSVLPGPVSSTSMGRSIKSPGSGSMQKD